MSMDTEIDDIADTLRHIASEIFNSKGDDADAVNILRQVDLLEEIAEKLRH
jgi:uncharacterized protein YutE (UPF0331/DUF86 family)